MADDWPSAEDLAKVLDVDNFDDWEDQLTAVISSAIAHVKVECDFDEGSGAPDDSQYSAALRMGELMSLRPGIAAKQLALDPSYQAHMYGHRRNFGIA